MRRVCLVPAYGQPYVLIGLEQCGDQHLVEAAVRHHRDVATALSNPDYCCFYADDASCNSTSPFWFCFGDPSQYYCNLLLTAEPR